MNWRSYRGNSDRIIISREINSNGSRLYTDMDHVAIAIEHTRASTYNNSRPSYTCWNEVLGQYGRMVFDIEFNRSDPIYDRITQSYTMNMYEPIGMKKDIENIIIDALISIGRYHHAEILKRDTIRWFNDTTFLHTIDTDLSPFCWMTCCRDEKISYHLTLPFVTCIESKDDSTTDPVYDGSNTLIPCMKQLYDAIERIAHDRLAWLHDNRLLDHSMLIPRHELRLPGMTKYGSEHVLKVQGRHTILHCISNMYPSFVPIELLYIMDQSIILEDKISIQYDPIDDNIYDMVPSYVKEEWTGIERVNDIVYLSSNIEYPECPVCRCIHDRNRPFISACDGYYTISCWQWYRVHRYDIDADYKGPIPIGTYQCDINPSRRENIVRRAIDRYTPITYPCTIHEKDIRSIPTNGDVYICSAMGTGKTKIVEPIINSASSYLVLSNRVIQANKYSILFPNSIIYGTDGWNDDSVERLIVQMESIHKIGNYDYDIVLLDEVETLLRLLISSTMKDKELYTIDTLMKVISRAKRIIVMDAFLKDDTVEFMKTIRYGKDHHIIVNTYRQVERIGCREMYILREKGQFMSMLAYDDSKKVVACLSKDIATTICSMLKEKGESTLLVTGDSDIVLKRTDPHTLWNRYHNIVYTSAIANSISYEYSGFNTLYVYGCTGTSYAEELIQMMGRVRSISNRRVYAYIVDTGSTLSYLPTSKSKVYNDMRYADKVFTHKVYRPHIASIWNCQSTVLKDLYARLYSDRGLDQKCFREVFIHIVSNVLGWTVKDDIVIEQLPKIKVDKVLSYNPIDREVYDSYIDPSYPIDDRDRIYNEIWRKGMKDIVLNMVNMVRRHTCSKIDKVGYKGIEMYNDLSTLFSIGNGDIENRCKIILRYSSKHRYDPIFKDSIHRLALCYGISPSYHIWKWLYKFLSIYLLMDCTYTSSTSNSTQIYEYHIDLSNWIYYYIRP